MPVKEVSLGNLTLADQEFLAQISDNFDSVPPIPPDDHDDHRDYGDRRDNNDHRLARFLIKLAIAIPVGTATGVAITMIQGILMH